MTDHSEVALWAVVFAVTKGIQKNSKVIGDGDTLKVINLSVSAKADSNLAESTITFIYCWNFP